MEAEQEIARLVYHYAELIDDGDLAGVAELFAEGCVAAPDGSEFHGAEAVLALYQRSTRIYEDSGTPCTQHVTTNLSICLEDGGDSATARSCFTVFQALDDFPLQPIIAGRYRDSFARRATGWVFLRREIQPRLLGDLSRHLLVDL
jgi:3-phenylpropionate/cinnamic acid dioxygenase small subunit